MRFMSVKPESLRFAVTATLKMARTHSNLLSSNILHLEHVHTDSYSSHILYLGLGLGQANNGKWYIIHIKLINSINFTNA